MSGLDMASCALTCWLLLTLSIGRGLAQLQVVSMDNRVLNASNIVVGSASDLALQVLCEAPNPAGPITWRNGDGMEVNQGLSPFGVSQENGSLRVYPVSTMLSLGVNNYICTDGVDSLMVQFDLRPHLFFTSPVPAQAPPTADITSLCPVPDIPAANVTAINGTGFSYCEVETERGAFRSRSIITEEATPLFRYEPQDIVVNPFNESSRAAFSCSVSGIKPLVSIQWYFEMMQLGSGMGLMPGPENGMLTDGSDNVTIFSGADVRTSRTSVLLLENVGNEHEGFYRCVVTFEDGEVLSSRNATLNFSATFAAQESIILAPPSSLTLIQSRDSLLLPCVSSGTTQPSFTLDGVSVTEGVTQFGFENSIVPSSTDGVYNCTVGTTSAESVVDISIGLFPPDTAAIFRTPNFVNPPEHIPSSSSNRLGCMSSSPVDLTVFLNGDVQQTVTNTLSLLFLPVVESGLYQCASSDSGLDLSNQFTDEEESLYFIAPFINGALSSISQAQVVNRASLQTVMVTCQTLANPLPRLSWSVNGDPSSNSVQSVTGFMETASSTITLSVGDLNLGANNMNCTISIDSVTIQDVLRHALVTVEAAPNITIPPENTTVTAPEAAMFTCSAEGFPLPSISWVRADRDRVQTVLVDGVDNVMISESSSTSTITSSLTLSLTSIRLNGEYTCVASNTLNSGMMASTNSTAQLTVNDAPSITIPPEDATVLAPEAAMFNCSAEGFPLPSISWVRVDRDGTQTNLTDGMGNVIISESSSTFEISSNLTISSTDLTLSGSYVICTAVNDFGSDNASALLTVNSAPNITIPPEDVFVVAPEAAVFNCSAEGNPLPSISWVNIDRYGVQTPVVDGVDNVIISESNFTFTTNSMLTISPSSVTYTYYMCVANNTFGSANATAQLDVEGAPEFIVSPVENVLVIDGEMISLECRVQGNPIPTIIWMVNTTNNTIEAIEAMDSNFDVTVMNDTSFFTRLSMVNFTAALDSPSRGNGTMFFCEASNRIQAGVESNRTLVTIAGPPLSPAINISVESRLALISWTEPFSLLPITNYIISVNKVMSGDPVNMVSIPVDTLYFNATSLRPNVLYEVVIVAVNRAGASDNTTERFTTLKDVPEGFPQNLRSTSDELETINVFWSFIPSNETNGAIIGYTIRYRLTSMTEEQFQNVTGGDILTVVLNITAGETYLISVAGRTAIGLGPYSPETSQETIPIPPTFPPDPLPTAGPPSVSTIPITLPSVPGAANSFSHYWVVVIRLSSSFDTSVDPSVSYPDNSTFTSYTSDVPEDTPYIVAEIGAANYQPLTTFVLGDEEGTLNINDFPALYINGALEQGARYTAFVRAFTNTVPDGRAKRQTGGQRQYTVFVSSPFINPISTATPAGISDGGIAGIVIALILLVIIVVAVIIISVVLYERYKLTNEYGFPQPPSRKGSMRIRDQREIIPTVTTLRNLKAEAELQNLSPEDNRLPVTVENFPEYVKSMHANTDHLFSEEYEILSIKSPSLPHVYCSLPYNVAKNRYANINCYDDTRAKLEPVPGIEGSDYINANYIDGYLEKRGFIATQGPLGHTSQDFWRLVWEQNSCCIIMLTNVVEKNRAKCHQYWPEVGSVTLGEITVSLIEIQQLAYYTVRTFKMSRGNDRREVKQFHYTGWPDFGVPDYPHPVMAFIKRINNFKRATPGPYIIHCSAGVGRTGTLMTIQAMMQMMEEEGKFDIFNFVLGLRHQRNYMVQTERQYIFIHDCILEIIRTGETSIPIQTLRRRHKELLAHDPQLDTSKMEAEYARLNELEMVEQSQFEPAKLPVNQPKNRYEDILPYDRYRVRLLLHPGVQGSDYINASYIDGYQHRHQYIVTQGPMKHTVTDFWRTIWEHRVSCILMLCPLEEKGKEQCVRYWPTEKINQQGDMFIELTQLTDYGSYTMREFSVTNTKINESRVIKHYQYSDWLEDTMPTNAATVIDLIGVLQKAQHMLGGGPIVVHDSSSVGRSATFCILGSVLEQLKVEGIVDLFACIHSLRHQQPGIVNSFELYKFCYQAVIEFLDSFDHYANFD